MKKILYAIMIFAFVAFISSCAKERIKGCTDPYALNYNPKASDNDGNCWSPSPAKKALIAEFTATWCGPCGEWGGPAFKDAVGLTFGLAEPMGLHDQDEMANAVTDEWLTYYNVTGIPTLIVWNQGQDFSDGASMAAAVDQELTVNTSEAGAVATWIDKGNTIEVDVSAGIFQQVSGDYYVAAYVMEDSLKFPQNGAASDGGYDANYIHNNVLRVSANAATWGEQFVYGNAYPGQVFTKTYTVTKGATWNAKNMYIVAVVWKYVKNQSTGQMEYKFVNVTNSRSLI